MTYASTMGLLGRSPFQLVNGSIRVRIRPLRFMSSRQLIGAEPTLEWLLGSAGHLSIAKLRRALMPAASTVARPCVDICQLAKKPRRLTSACSTMNAVAAPNSPPVEKPCNMRATIMINDDAMPIRE